MVSLLLLAPAKETKPKKEEKSKKEEKLEPTPTSLEDDYDTPAPSKKVDYFADVPERFVVYLKFGNDKI